MAIDIAVKHGLKTEFLNASACQQKTMSWDLNNEVHKQPSLEVSFDLQ
jgi:hypothetical protein